MEISIGLQMSFKSNAVLDAYNAYVNATLIAFGHTTVAADTETVDDYAGEYVTRTWMPKLAPADMLLVLQALQPQSVLMDANMSGTERKLLKLALAGKSAFADFEWDDDHLFGVGDAHTVCTLLAML